MAASRTYSTGSISANTESPGAGLDWCTIDELSNSALAEIQSLLDENYVADKLGGIRLIYPEALLRWILDWPGVPPGWRLGVRFDSKLIGFVSASPCALSYCGDRRRAAFINLLCVHRDWRSRGLGPALIEALTRRVMATGTSVAAFTRRKPLPIPALSSADYYCRPLNVERLTRIGYLDVRCPPPAIAAADGAQERFMHLDETMLDSLRTLLGQQGIPLALRQGFSAEEISYWCQAASRDAPAFRVRARVEAGSVSSFYSYYVLCQQIKDAESVTNLRCGVLYHHAAESHAMEQMIASAMAHALHYDECDLFFALPIMGIPASLLTKLHFRSTDASIFYYLFNWEYRAHAAQEIGLTPV